MVKDAPASRGTPWLSRMVVLLAVVWLGGAAAAWGQSAPADDPNEVNVRDFGAKGDGVADDTAAFDAAMTAVRTRHTIGHGQPGITGQAYVARLLIPAGRYRVTHTLNWTNLVSLSLEIDCQGCIIDGQTNGTPVIDALGSRWLKVNGLTVEGSATAAPSIGVQIGRTTGAPADGNEFRDLTLAGTFGFAALYDFAAETTMFDHLQVWNGSQTDTGFGVVLDGLNHWHAASAFTPVTAPPDRGYSFNEALFLNPSIISARTAIWIAGTARARFLTGYAVAKTCGTVLYASGAWPVTQLFMDVHYEPAALPNVFCIDGPPGTRQASIRGLHYTDQYPEASNALFKVEPNVASVAMQDADIRIDNFYGRDAKVFDNPAQWTVTGRYAEISGNHWNLPANRFQGTTSLAGRVRVMADTAPTAGVPARSSSPCSPGQMAADSGYVYVCVAADRWKRAALAGW